MAGTQVRILTPEGRVSFPHVFRPHAFNKDQEPKYSLTLLLPKNSPAVQKWVEETKSICDRLIKERWGDNPPKKIHYPFRDGDEESYDGYAGNWFIAARNGKDKNGVDHKPMVVRKLRDGTTELLREEDFYPGCYAIMSIVPFVFDQPMKKGVTFSLQNVLKTRDGSSFGATSNPNDDFAEAPATSEDGAEGVSEDVEDNGLF